MKKLFADIETKDNEVVTVRVTLPSKLQWSKTAKANGWDFEDPQQNAFVAWHAATRAGLIEEMTYEEFCSGGVLDVEIRNDDADLDPEENPTN